MIPLLFFIAGSAFATVAYIVWKVWVAYRQWEPLVLSSCVLAPKRIPPPDAPEREPCDDPVPSLFSVRPNGTIHVDMKDWKAP